MTFPNKRELTQNEPYVMVARCCRVWPVIGIRMARCGVCGERPTLDLQAPGS